MDIPGYSILRRDRRTVQHGGVCLFIKDDYSKYKRLDVLQCCQEHEILWDHLRPKRLPIGFSCLIVVVIYRPDPSPANDVNIREHLSSSLALAEPMYPNWALLVCGDFNRLNTQALMNHFRLKQIVKVPTCKDVTLDLILTNLQAHYNDPNAFPPFGLSDHNTVVAVHRRRENTSKTHLFRLKRDMRASCKVELGRYLGSMDWSVIFSGLQHCEDMFKVFQEVITTGLDLLMPLKRVRIDTRDPPWMNNHLKSLILKRQQAFHKQGADSQQFRFYRNAVNRKRKH